MVEENGDRMADAEPGAGHDPPSDDFKAFVGGISWALDDYRLKDCECCRLISVSIGSFIGQSSAILVSCWWLRIHTI
jgi:hypothetical protein